MGLHGLSLNDFSKIIESIRRDIAFAEQESFRQNTTFNWEGRMIENDRFVWWIGH